MKNLILILGLFLSLSIKAQTRHGYSDNSGFKTGHGITVGGVIFSVAGFMTPQNYTYTYTPNSTSSYNYTRQTLPFLKQGPRAACIVTGITLTCTGLITMMTGK